MLTVRLKKIIKSLHQKKFQQKYNKFIVETPKVVSELVKSGTFKIEAIYAISDWIDENQNLAHKIEDKIIEISEKELQQISNLVSANSVLAVVHKSDSSSDDLDMKEWCIYLDDVKDPGNIGTIIRTAEWFNVQQILFSHKSVDPYNSKIIQSSMGSYFRTKIMVNDLMDIANQDFCKYALDMNGEDIFEIGNLKPGVIVVGSESQGVSSAILENCNHVLSIPSSGKAESLNAAMACGIALSALCR